VRVAPASAPPAEKPPAAPEKPAAGPLPVALDIPPLTGLVQGRRGRVQIQVRNTSQQPINNVIVRAMLDPVLVPKAASEGFVPQNGGWQCTVNLPAPDVMRPSVGVEVLEIEFIPSSEKLKVPIRVEAMRPGSSPVSKAIIVDVAPPS
jgi:hypothetical protein